MARALRRGVPVAKIIHQKWFYGLRFYTNKYTLDPRPDTETLVSAVISDVNHNNGVQILDLGTGTGCIAVALAKNIPNAHVLAIEKSRGAARVARKNVRDLNATDSVYEGEHIHEPLQFITIDPDDEFSILETTLDRVRWFAFRPALPADKLSNINYGQRNEDLSTTKILKVNGVSNGYSNIFYFRKRKGEWELYRYEDSSM